LLGYEARGEACDAPLGLRQAAAKEARYDFALGRILNAPRNGDASAAIHEINQAITANKRDAARLAAARAAADAIRAECEPAADFLVACATPDGNFYEPERRLRALGPEIATAASKANYDLSVGGTAEAAIATIRAALAAKVTG